MERRLEPAANNLALADRDVPPARRAPHEPLPALRAEDVQRPRALGPNRVGRRAACSSTSEKCRRLPASPSSLAAARSRVISRRRAWP